MDSERRLRNQSIEHIREHLRQYGQEHLLRFWGELNEGEKNSLLEEIENINLDEVTGFFKQINGENDNREVLDPSLKPVPSELHGSVSRANADELKSFEDKGMKQIADGHVGALLLAGGQGTRLGVSYPKGMYNVELPSNKTLFQIQAERILKLQRLAEARFSKPCTITWYIMTSDATKERTKKFFDKHNYFGLKEENIVMFEQGMLPCFDFNGKILLESKSKVAKSPDGNGGLYRALKEQDILQDMDKRGVKYLHVYCVDNILVKVADPIFIGYCVSKGADCAAKVVEKKDPKEPIGVVCDVNGKLQVLEYSEISPEVAGMKNEDNRLTYNAGNICNHFFTSEFLKNVANKYETNLRVHKAVKKIPCVDENGEKITPTESNGIKIEKFVFDVFPFSLKFVIWEVPREEEFSALKNPAGAKKDSPDTSRQDVYRLHKIFIEKAGGIVSGDGPCEVSPLLSYAGEGLEDVCKGRSFICSEETPVILNSPGETKFLQNGFH